MILGLLGRALRSPGIRLIMVRFDARTIDQLGTQEEMDIFQPWDVEDMGHDYLESEINKLEDCLW